jgi:folate-binding protein YgfZ
MSILNLDKQLLLLEVSGNDATTYLQGQLSNDIRQLQHQPYQLTAHLNNKGRILASFWAMQINDNHYYLITTKSIETTIVSRLKLFVLRSKVNLTLSSHHLTLAPQAGKLGFKLADQLHLQINPAQELNAIEDSNLWHQILVNLNLPLIYADTQEKIIPQQINYDLIGGISFKKGCYTGQEIVARTHYLGKVKRRLAKFSSNSNVVIGQRVVSPMVDNQEVGIIIDCYQKDSKQFDGLISVQTDCINALFLENHTPLKNTQLINPPHEV